jgi:transcriptional regulator with XRE-family HTH domain
MSVMRQNKTTEEWETLVGAQFRAARIAADLDQASLAEQADVSIGAIKNLEAGKGSSLKTVVRVLRALDRTDWLESLAPPVSISPMALLASKRSGTRPRQRVVHSRHRART